MSTPPSLPPVVKGRRDEFSGGRDILKAKGLKAAYAHFLSAGPPPAALNCDTELPGISAGFEIRQGRAMELAPLMEVRRSPLDAPLVSRVRRARDLGLPPRPSDLIPPATRSTLPLLATRRFPSRPRPWI